MAETPGIDVIPRDVLMILGSFISRVVPIVVCGLLIGNGVDAAGHPPPVLRSCFPAGCQAGQSTELTVSGDNLQNLSTLQCSIPGVECVFVEALRFRLTIPPDAPLGHCEIWAVSNDGISAPYTLIIGNRDECLESEPNDSDSLARSVPLNTVVNGKIEKADDSDYFRFTASAGQRVIIECHAERLDSTLRAVLEVFDAQGKRLAVNRGYFGTDPLIDLQVSADGLYVIRVMDLIASGGAQSIYRLAIDTGPRVAFAIPNVVQRGKASRITLNGWNLTSVDGKTGGSALNSVEVDLPASLTVPTAPLPVRLLSTQSVIAGHSFAYHFPGSHAPVVMGIVDVPVVQDHSHNHSPDTAQELTLPCEVSGQLITGDERDWFTFAALRGEVFYMEALGQRIQSPVDLQISVLDTMDLTEPHELASFGDEVRNIGGAFRTDHPDPCGRWVCPADGRYLIVVGNVTGGLHADPRRVYRLSILREEPDVQVVAVPHRNASSGINVQHNGRVVLDLVAMRRRGLDGSIRVSASNLPAGVEFPDVWLGPGVCRTVGVLSADRNATNVVDELILEAVSDVSPWSPHPVNGGTVRSSPVPNTLGRLTSQIRMAVAGEAVLKVTADAHRTVDHHLYGTLQAHHSPGGIVDVALQIERRNATHQAPVRLIGVGLPDSIGNQTQIIPEGQLTGYLSFYLPPTLPAGHYSFAVQAETTVPNADNKAESVTVFSNSVTIEVQPAAFLVNVDPFAATQAKRGEVFQVAYNVRRLNGFIGKMHTELAGAGIITDVPGLRGRGVTFVGQTDQGSIQIEVNGNATLGERQFLRLFTVGVVEDEPVFHGSHFLMLEITD